MSTNYSFIPNKENYLHVYGEIHLGKSSGGWSFSFHGYDQQGGNVFVEVDRYSGLQVQVTVPTLIVKDYGMVIALVNSGGIIQNEYGQTVSTDDFFELVDSKIGGLNHSLRNPSERNWIDADGHSFSGYDFS